MATFLRPLSDRYDWLLCRLSSRWPYGLIKIAVILAVLALSWWFGKRPSLRLIQLLAIALGGVIVVISLLRRPYWGLLGLVSTSFLVPVQIATGTRIPVNVTVLLVPVLLGLWLIDALIRKRGFNLIPHLANRPLLFFCLAGLVSLLWGLLIWPPDVPLPDNILIVGAGQWVLYTFSIGVWLLAGNQIKEERELKILVWVFISLGFAYSLTETIPFLRQFLSLWPAGVKGAMLWIWLVALCGGQLLFNQGLSLQSKLFYTSVLGMVIYNRILGRIWVAGWSSVLVVILALIWLRSWKLGLVASLVLGLLIYCLFPQISVLVWNETEALSVLGRQQAYTLFFRETQASPILGLGLGAAWHYIRARYLWPGFGLKPPEITSHNNYVDIYADTGLIGLSFFLWGIIAIALSAWRLRRNVRRGFGLGYVNAGLGGLAGSLFAMMLGQWFLPSLYNNSFSGFRSSMLAWIFLGGLVALNLITKNRDG